MDGRKQMEGCMEYAVISYTVVYAAACWYCEELRAMMSSSGICVIEGDGALHGDDYSVYGLYV